MRIGHLFLHRSQEPEAGCPTFQIGGSFFVTVHGNSAERGDEPQNIEQGTPNVEGKKEIPVKWEQQHGIDESG